MNCAPEFSRKRPGNLCGRGRKRRGSHGRLLCPSEAGGKPSLSNYTRKPVCCSGELRLAAILSRVAHTCRTLACVRRLITEPNPAGGTLDLYPDRTHRKHRDVRATRRAGGLDNGCFMPFWVQQVAVAEEPPKAQFRGA